jgi:hypothetical protein
VRVRAPVCQQQQQQQQQQQTHISTEASSQPADSAKRLGLAGVARNTMSKFQTVTQ